MNKEEWNSILQVIAPLHHARSGNLRQLVLDVGEDPRTVFVGTRMDGVDVRGQDLTGIIFTHLDIDKIRWDENTIFDLNLLREYNSISDTVEMIESRSSIRRDVTGVPLAREIRKFGRHAFGVLSCAVSPDGKTVVSTSDENFIRQWEFTTGREIRTLEGHQQGVTACSFSRDGKTLLSGSRDKTIRLWDVANGKILRTLGEHRWSVSACALSPDASGAVSACSGVTFIWDVVAEKSVRVFETSFDDAIEAFAYSLDGTIVAMGSRNGVVRLCDAKTGIDKKLIKIVGGHVTCCSFAPDGGTLLLGGWHFLALFDVHTGNEIRRLEGSGVYVGACAFSPDGDTVLSTIGQRSLGLWDVATHRVYRSERALLQP